MKLVQENLQRVISSMLLVLIVLLSVAEKMGVSTFSLFYVVGAGLIITGLAAFGAMKLRGRLATGLSVLICIGIVVGVIGVEQAAEFAAGYVAWLMGTPTENALWAEGFAVLQVVLLSVICFLFQLLSEKLIWLERIVAGALLLCCVIDLITKRALGKGCVICALLYMCMVYVAWIQETWEKRKSKQLRQYMVCMMPFLALYLFLMTLMPFSDNPYDWQFVKNIYKSLKENFTVITQNLSSGDREDFDTGTTGFSEDGKLLGGITEEDRILMEIQGQKSLKTNVYLVGKVYDTFTGRQWKQELMEQTNDRKLDALETIFALWKYEEENRENYIYSTKLDINYRYFHTGYLFSPLKTWDILEDKGNKMPYTEEGCNVLFPNKKGYGTEYDVHFFQINVDHPLFYKFLEGVEPERLEETSQSPLLQGQWTDVKKKETDEEILVRVQKAYNKDSDSKNRYTLEDLEQHRKLIYENYGQKDIVSAQVKEYLKEMTAEATTDIEKLKAIEAELASYTYTMTPGKLPENITSAEEFLDYFLLESKQGFCSYFATAFVLLAREEGIPARYVEGFCVPVEGQKKMYVYSNMAHAWPEVYIDGVGWIPFEPTPGYDRIRYTPWEMGSNTKSHHLEAEAYEDEIALQEATERAEQEREIRKNYLGQIVTYTLFAVVVILVVLIFVDRYLGKRRFRKWSLEKIFRMEVQKNLHLLSLLGYQRRPWETLEELEQRAWAVMYADTEDNTLTGKREKNEKIRFLYLYQEVLYGERAVEESMLRTVRAERLLLEKRLKLRNKWAYVYYKIKDLI